MINMKMAKDRKLTTLLLQSINKDQLQLIHCLDDKAKNKAVIAWLQEKEQARTTFIHTLLQTSVLSGIHLILAHHSICPFPSLLHIYILYSVVDSIGVKQFVWGQQYVIRNPKYLTFIVNSISFYFISDVFFSSQIVFLEHTNTLFLFFLYSILQCVQCISGEHHQQTISNLKA